MNENTNTKHGDVLSIAMKKKQAMEDIAVLMKNQKTLALGESIVHRGQALAGEVEQAALMLVAADDLETAKYVHEVALTMRTLSQKVLPVINCRLARMVITEAEARGFCSDNR
jgi:hypothetical protein